MDVDIDVDVDIDSCFGYLKWVSKSVQILFHCIEAVMVLTSIILKERAL